MMYIPNRADRRYEALISGEMHVCSGKSTPAPPDYRGAAEETAASNKEAMTAQTHANRPDQYTPFGTTTWENSTGVDPATGKAVTSWEQYTQLNPESQRALDAQLQLQANKSELGSSMYGRMEDEYGNPMNWDQFRDVGEAPGATDSRDRAEQAIYDRSTSRLDPQWEQKTSQLEAKLAAQGLRPGDKAYDQAMSNNEMAKTDAYQQATYGSIMGGGAEGARDFGMGMQEAEYNTKLRQQEMTEEMTKRGFSLNEINAIISGQQVGMPSMPGFNTAGNAGGVDYTGAAKNQYGAEMDQFNADQAMMNSLMQGAGMAGGAMMMSDRRLKRHIKRLGTFKRYPWYIFQYIWGEWAVGVMADEVNEDAVVVLPNGFAAVDYTRIR